MTYDPMQYATARAGIVGQTAGSIRQDVVNAASKISEIVKQKNIDKKIQALYVNELKNFADEAYRIDSSKPRESYVIQGRKIYKPPMKELGAEDNLKMLLRGDLPAQKYLDNLQTKADASTFMDKAEQPISETRQTQAEGPPVQQGERAGEVPMEEKTVQRPMRGAEYEKGFEGLTPEAREMVPESVGERVKSTEEIFQQPLKTFEEERNKEIKERDTNIKTMTGISKEAGFNTAIIESKNSAEGLKTKKKSLNDLVKAVTKANNIGPKQIASGKQTDMQLEIERMASELKIPEQLATDIDFLGRMDAEIDRLIREEEGQQETWETAKTDWEKRLKEEARRKATPKPPQATPDWKLGKELQSALEKMAKQQFPNLFKVIEGEYGIDVMKQTSGIAEAARAILRDPQKRIALAYAFPEEVGSIARAKGAPKPSDATIQAVLSEMQSLQDSVYGAIQGTPSPEEDIFSGLGELD